MSLASVALTNQVLDSMSGGATNFLAYVALHSTPGPDTTGSHEFSDGTYARQACNWNIASGSQKVNSSTLSFPNAGTVQATHFGTFAAATGTTYGIGGAFSSPVTAATITAAPGALSLTAG